MEPTNFRPVLGAEYWSGLPLVFRSNTPPGAAREDYLVPDFGLTVIDLRTPAEAQANPHALRGREGYRNLPLHSAQQARPASPVYELDELYRFWLAQDEVNLARIFDACAGDSDTTLVCCSAGKDRTGIIVAILSRLWGASDSDLARDYALSGVNMRVAFEAELAASMNPDQTRRMISADPAAILRVIHGLEAAHGTIAGYLRRIGVAESRLEILRGLAS